MYAVIARWTLTNQWIERLAALGLGAVTAFMFVNVVLRYLFNAPISWGDELVQFTFIWLVFLGAVAAMKSNSHYAVETLMEVLPKVPAVAVGVLTDVAVIVICGVLAWYGYRIMMLFSFQSSPSLELPMVIVNSSLPLAALLMGVVRGAQMIERIRVDLLGGMPLARHVPSITHHAP